MNEQSRPTVGILLATYNGGRYVDEQINSIRAQVEVNPLIIVSDDSSTDSTLSSLRAHAATGPMQVLPASTERFGSAGRNFLRLIRDCPVLDQDYYAFSDQDDIWLADKLQRSISTLRATNSVVYSSNVEAFWPDGRTVILDKAQPLVRHDHLFESAGPGCTFVMRQDFFIRLRTWVIDNYTSLQSVRVHDWAIYAWARTRGETWVIDPAVTVRYRQHASNEQGANVGPQQAWTRAKRLLDGSFRKEALQIADAVGDKSPAVEALRRLALIDRFKLVARASDARRRWRDQQVIRVFFLLTH